MWPKGLRQDAEESAASCGTDENSQGLPVAFGALPSDGAVDCPHPPSSAQPATAVTSKGPLGR